MESKGSDWNQRYLDGDTPWDKGRPAPALLELLKQGAFESQSDIVVPGCGYGHDVSALAGAGHLVTGLDISESALAGARLANSGPGIHYAYGDWFDPDLAEGRKYDCIWEHTCFCAIHPDQRDDYVAAAHRFLKPDGVLIGVFFAFGDDQDGPPYKTNIATLHRHFGSLFELLWERRPETTFSGREGEEWLMAWRRK